MRLQSASFTVLLALGLVSLAEKSRAQSVSFTEHGSSCLVVQRADSSQSRPKPIRIICARSITPGNSPLFIVDGQPISDQSLQSINPNDIAKIEVLKDVAATALYGVRGANGVVLITLLHPQRKYLHQPAEKESRLD